MSGDGASPVPSSQARELVRGAFDLHVHVLPDVIPRRVDDLTLARRFVEVGLAGFALKSHYTSTAERAEVLRAVVPDLDVLGGIALNQAVGGLNPVAVAIAAREGARIVWLPTVDAANEAGRPRKPGAPQPMWIRVHDDLRQSGIEVEPVPVLDGGGQPLPELREVLRVVAHHRLVLATGHLGRDEIFTAVDAALEEGVGDILVTHPDYPSQDLSVADQCNLAERGILLERCFAPAYTGKVKWEQMIEATRAAGAASSVFGTDLGQPANPPVEDGLALLADQYLKAGFDEHDVWTMAVGNTRRLAAGPAVGASEVA